MDGDVVSCTKCGRAEAIPKVYCRTCDISKLPCHLCIDCDWLQHTGQVCSPCPHERVLMDVGVFDGMALAPKECIKRALNPDGSYGYAV